MQKIREKSVVIKSERCFGLKYGGKCGKKWYKEKEKCILEFRIEFSDPMLMTLDTTHGPNTKLLTKILKNAGKKGEK